MEEKDYCIVLVGNTQVGLMGLKGIFEELKSEKGKTDAVIKERLIEKVGYKNYIPRSVREEYEKALYREFKKFLGEKVEEEKSGFLEVAILGPGCYSCNKLEQDVMAVLSEMGMQASLNHITDPSMMAQYGVIITPALIVNGKVKSKGTIPPKSMIRKWLEEEKG
jgi:small redox-active disulfide protein 2